MEAKVKAIELVSRMINGFQFTIDNYTAKQCALIAVDEILKSKPYWETQEELEYWEEVKQHIIIIIN